MLRGRDEHTFQHRTKADPDMCMVEIGDREVGHDDKRVDAHQFVYRCVWRDHPDNHPQRHTDDAGADGCPDDQRQWMLAVGRQRGQDLGVVVDRV